MRPTERRKEVIYRGLVRNVNHRETSTPPETVALEKVVVPDGHVKQVACAHARRVMVVVFASRAGICRNVEPYCDAGQMDVELIGVEGVA